MIELFEMKWLFEIAVAAVFHCGLFHAVNVVGSDGNDRDVLSMSLELSKTLYHLEAVKHGHIQIDNHQARPVLSGQVESLSVMVARRAIESADIVVLLVDATAGATDQDATIAGEAELGIIRDFVRKGFER